MIPDKVALTFCQSCQEQIGSRFSVNSSMLCTTGCRWDGRMSRDRPVIVVTYWRRDASAPFTHHPRCRGHVPEYPSICLNEQHQIIVRET